MRHPHPMYKPHSQAQTLPVPPISTVLFPTVQLPPLNIPPAVPPSDERCRAMQKWAEGRSYIHHLVDCDKTPPREDCLLVYQFLMIMWSYINGYPSRLLKRFTVYDFVNFSESSSGSFVCAVEDGTKYKYRTALRFSEFEKRVLTFYFKRIRTFWIDALRLLNSESFDVTSIATDFKERTQSFFYNSQGNKQLNVSRVCENFQSKMNVTHIKKRKLTDAAGPVDKVRITQNVMMTISPTSKKRFFYSDSQFVESFNGVSS